MTAPVHEGRCYCGQTKVTLNTPADVVAVCHCSDCKRWTGAPLPAFAAFPAHSLTSDLGPGRQANEEVRRWNCQTCGSPLAATFAYLPDQVYIPLGILDSAAALIPDVQCHSESALAWVHLDDSIPQESGSARATLLAGHSERDK